MIQNAIIEKPENNYGIDKVKNIQGDLWKFESTYFITKDYIDKIKNMTLSDIRNMKFSKAIYCFPSITEKNKKFWIKISVLFVPEIIFASLWALNYMHLSELIQILQNLTFSDPVPGVYYYIHYQSSDVSYSVGFWVISLMILTVIIERWAPWVSNKENNDRLNYQKIGLVKNGMRTIEDLKDIRTTHESN